MSYSNSNFFTPFQDNAGYPQPWGQPNRHDSAPYGARGAPPSPWISKPSYQPTINFPTPHLSVAEPNTYWPEPVYNPPRPQTRSTFPFPAPHPAPHPHIHFYGHFNEPSQFPPNPYDQPASFSFPGAIHEEPEEISPISDTSSDDFSRLPTGQHDSCNELSLDRATCSMLVSAVQDMEIIKTMFCSWFEQLPDDLTPGHKPRRTQSLEQNVSIAIGTLKRDATFSLSKSKEIVQKYRDFIYAFDERLRVIEHSRGGKLQYTEELERLDNEITALSSDITTCVRKMSDNLHELAKTIENTKDEAQKKAMWGKFLLGMETSLKVLNGVFGIGSAVTQLAPPVGTIVSVCLGGAAVVLVAAAELSKKVRKEHCDETAFDTALRYLREDIPKALESAEKSLTSFQASHMVLNHDMTIREGMSVSASAASAARKTWQEAGRHLDMLKNPTRNHTC